ncbi:MAG: F0F1 ATP synthase subunit epsilon [Verrucomicrobiota bacterium]|nr:F0F1 ATP synthase subunit epsilon [Verrucomicrobiota bacterium]
MAAFKLSILTPDGFVYEGTTDYVQATALDGSFGVLPHHDLLLSVLKAGIVTVARDDATLRFSVDGGIAEVRDNHMTILASRVIPMQSWNPMAVCSPT